LNIFLKDKRYYILIAVILIFAVVFRLESFFLNREGVYDEINLICNFIEHNGFFWAFKPLDYGQMAPPLFLIFTKLTTYLFNGAELGYRFLPLIEALISIPIFYILSKKFLQTQRAIIFANFLYAINFALIRYASEFKQYSGDILIFMLLLLLFDKKDFSALNFKAVLKWGIIFSLLFLVSQPVIFLLFGVISYSFIEALIKLRKNIKRNPNLNVPVKFDFMTLMAEFKFCLIPILPLIVVFAYKSSMPQTLNLFMQNFWHDGFITFGGLLNLTKENLNFFFYGVKCLMFLSPLIFTGFFICLVNAVKKDGAKINRILLLSLFGVFLASILHLYPYLHRLILFLFPFFIIFISKNFDVKLPLMKLDKVLTIGIIVFVLMFLPLFYFGIICKTRISTLQNLCRGRDITIILKEQYKDGDLILTPSYNKNFLTVYSKMLKFDVDKSKIIVIKEDENPISSFDKAIKEGKPVWLYLPAEYKNRPTLNPLINYAKLNNIPVLYKINLDGYDGPDGFAHLYKIGF